MDRPNKTIQNSIKCICCVKLYIRFMGHETTLVKIDAYWKNYTMQKAKKTISEKTLLIGVKFHKP